LITFKNKKSIIKGALVGIASIIALSTAVGSFVSVGGGEIVRVQNNISGNSTWYTTEGYRLKVPFFSNTVTYPQEVTVAITDNPELCDTASVCAAPRQVGFSDTYGITIESSFRYSLPRTSIELESMHDKVKNIDNLLGTTLLPFSQDLINYTSNQFRAEGFMQGGQNEFKSRMIDQAANGLVKTRREKVEVVTEKADRNTERDAGTSVGEQFRWEVTVVTDELGNPVRTDSAIKAYGITLVPSGINVVDFVPEPRLKDFMVQKQDRVRARAKIVEDQENERELAITAQLRGDRERIEVQNRLLKEKDAAKIKGDQAVMLAELTASRETIERQKVADLAIIDKERELQVAKANENIQKANAVAARYEAEAIKQKGFAEAEVAKAALAAKQANKDIYMAELSLKETMAMAEVLPQVNITSPQVVMGGNSGGSQVSDLLSTKLVQDIMRKPSK
jgi:hypothetical protein